MRGRAGIVCRCARSGRLPRLDVLGRVGVRVISRRRLPSSATCFCPLMKRPGLVGPLPLPLLLSALVGDLARFALSLNQCLNMASCCFSGCWWNFFLRCGGGTYDGLRRSGFVVTCCNMLALPRLIFRGRRITGLMPSFGGGGGRLRLLLTSSFSGNFGVALVCWIDGGGVSDLPSATCGISSTWLRRLTLAFLLDLLPRG